MFGIHTPRYLDLSLILRGLFASSVVVWHVEGWRETTVIPDVLNLPGRVAVWMFFGLSGYVIALGFFSGRYRIDGDGLRRFYLRRAARILPLFWGLTSIALLLGRWVPTGYEPNFANIVASVLTLQWIHQTYPVGVFWTLGIELHFYLIAPVLCWGLIRAGRWWPWVGCGALALLWGIYGDRIDARTLPATLMFFVVGVLMARWASAGDSAGRSPRSWRAAGIWILLGVLCLMVAADGYPGRFWDYRGSALSLLALVFLLQAHIIVEKRQIAAGPIGRALMVVGALAYGLYAWHGLLLTFSSRLADSLILTYGLSLGLAWLSFICLERPIMAAAKGRKAGLPIPGRPET